MSMRPGTFHSILPLVEDLIADIHVLSTSATPPEPVEAAEGITAKVRLPITHLPLRTIPCFRRSVLHPTHDADGAEAHRGHRQRNWAPP